MSNKVLSQIWYARGCQVLADGRVQTTTQTDPSGQQRVTYHPTLALICHVGTPELAKHIVDLHNKSLETLELMGGRTHETNAG